MSDLQKVQALRVLGIPQGEAERIVKEGKATLSPSAFTTERRVASPDYRLQDAPVCEESKPVFIRKQEHVFSLKVSNIVQLLLSCGIEVGEKVEAVYFNDAGGEAFTIRDEASIDIHWTEERIARPEELKQEHERQTAPREEPKKGD